MPYVYRTNPSLAHRRHRVAETFEDSGEAAWNWLPVLGLGVALLAGAAALQWYAAMDATPDCNDDFHL